jgi:hypothetical protein
MINENLAIILVILARLAIDISVQGQGLWLCSDTWVPAKIPSKY